MRCHPSLPCVLIGMWVTVLAAAGPGTPSRPEPRKPAAPPKTEIKPQATPTPAPQTAVKRAASNPAPSKPVAARSTPTPTQLAPRLATASSDPPRETKTPSAPLPKPSAPPASASAAGTATRRELPRSSDLPEPATTRRALRESSVWLSSVQAQHSAYTERLAQDQRALGRIERDVALSALSSNRNRKEAAIPAVEAMRAFDQRDWVRQLNAGGSRPAPMAVEHLMRQGESIAFRTSTSTADTEGLLARIRRTPGVAAGGHLGLSAMVPDLVTTHLRIIPGSLSSASARPSYGLQNVDALRARLEIGRAELAREYSGVRERWLQSSARSEELQREYLQLRKALVAPDGL